MVKISGTDIVKAYTGGTEVKAIYSGGVKVWPDNENSYVIATFTQDTTMSTHLTIPFNVEGFQYILSKSKSESVWYKLEQKLPYYTITKIDTLKTSGCCALPGGFLVQETNQGTVKNPNYVYKDIDGNNVTDFYFNGYGVHGYLNVWYNSDGKCYYNCKNHGLENQRSVRLYAPMYIQTSGKYSYGYTSKTWYKSDGSVFLFDGKDVWKDGGNTPHLSQNGTEYILKGNTWVKWECDKPSAMPNIDAQSIFREGENVFMVSYDSRYRYWWLDRNTDVWYECKISVDPYFNPYRSLIWNNYDDKLYFINTSTTSNKCYKLKSVTKTSLT